MRTRIRSLATAVPDHRLGPDRLLELLARFWPQVSRLDLDPDQLGTRHLVLAPDALLEPRGLEESMRLYREHAVQLAETVATAALSRAALAPEEVDLVVSVSCTGYMIPSLETYLAARLGMRSDVIRVPLTELGCAGGAAGLGLAHRHLAGHPRHRVLVVVVELSSLSFRASNASHDNLIASMVFGDGAAAAVVEGDGPGPGLRIEASASHLLPGTTGLLGFDLRDDGFQVVLSRRLPGVLEKGLGRVIEDFRLVNGPERLDFVAAHGGGPRIVEAVEAALDLEPSATAASREVFRRVGNVSAASLLFTLAELEDRLDGRPAQGIGLGLGPGLSADLLHLRHCP